MINFIKKDQNSHRLPNSQVQGQTTKIQIQDQRINNQDYNHLINIWQLHK